MTATTFSAEEQAGLRSSEAARRLAQDGPNRVPRARRGWRVEWSARNALPGGEHGDEGDDGRDRHGQVGPRGAREAVAATAVLTSAAVSPARGVGR